MIAISCYIAGIEPSIPAHRFDNAVKLLLAAGMPIEDLARTPSNKLADSFARSRCVGRRVIDRLHASISYADGEASAGGIWPLLEPTAVLAGSRREGTSLNLQWRAGTGPESDSPLLLTEHQKRTARTIGGNDYFSNAPIWNRPPSQSSRCQVLVTMPSSLNSWISMVMIAKSLPFDGKPAKGPACVAE